MANECWLLAEGRGVHSLPRTGSAVPAHDSALIVHRFGGETDALVWIAKCAAPDVVLSPSTGLKTSRRATASLFSARSLAPLAERHGLHLHGFSPTTHWFYKVMPAWAVVQREKTRPPVGVVWSGTRTAAWTASATCRSRRLRIWAWSAGFLKAIAENDCDSALPVTPLRAP